jgi:hypothetical protein
MPRDEITREAVEFTATVGLNRGTDLRNFDDVAEAMEWLIRYDPSKAPISSDD